MLFAALALALLSCSPAQAAPQGDRLSTYAQFFQTRQVTKADLIRRQASARLTARQSTISPGFCTVASDCTKIPTAAKSTCQEGLCVFQCPATSTLNSAKTACECPTPQVLNAASTACVQCSMASNCPAPPENSVSVCTTAGACGFVCNGGFTKSTDSVTKVTTCVSALTPFQDCPYIDGFYLRSDLTSTTKQCAYTKNGDASLLVQYCTYYRNTGVLLAQPVPGPNQPKLVCPNMVAAAQENKGSACYVGCPAPLDGYDSRSVGSISIYRSVTSIQPLSMRILSCQYGGYADNVRCGYYPNPPCSVPQQSCTYDLVTGNIAEYYDPVYGRARYGPATKCPTKAVASTQCISSFAEKVSFNPDYVAVDSRY